MKRQISVKAEFKNLSRSISEGKMISQLYVNILLSSFKVRRTLADVA